MPVLTGQSASTSQGSVAGSNNETLTPNVVTILSGTLTPHVIYTNPAPWSDSPTTGDMTWASGSPVNQNNGIIVGVMGAF
jgi:hypothetical protein